MQCSELWLCECEIIHFDAGHKKNTNFTTGMIIKMSVYSQVTTLN